MATTIKQYLATRGLTFTSDGSVVPIAGGDGGGANSPGAGGSEIPRAQSHETETEDYTVQTTGAVEQCFAHLKIVSANVYATGGISAGAHQPPAGDVYIGRAQRSLPDIRGVGDENYAFIIPETAASEKQTGRIYVKGTAGDVIVMVYRR
jgi:hypothetical protein